jgi:hypothetical protein
MSKALPKPNYAESGRPYVLTKGATVLISKQTGRGGIMFPETMLRRIKSVLKKNINGHK